MATFNDYTFNDMGRMGSDLATLSQEDIQNNKGSEYLLTNHFLSDSTMSKSIAFATSHPAINYKGTHHTSLGGSNIDNNSKLLIGKEMTREHTKLSLLERPYLTIPYLGRGKVDADLESDLLQGESYTNRKSSNLQTEVSYIPYSHTPLIPSVEESVANPANFVESNDIGFLRGAVDTRNLNRDKMK